MENVGGNKLLYFLAGVAVGGIIVYSALSPQIRSLLAKTAGKGLKLKEDAAALIESIKEDAEDFAAEEKEIIENAAQKCSSILYLAIGDILMGIILIDDPVIENAYEIVEGLRESGINQVVMITGDGEKDAALIHNTLTVGISINSMKPLTKDEK